MTRLTWAYLALTLGLSAPLSIVILGLYILVKSI